MSDTVFKIPNDISEVADLYGGRLAGVSFPGVTAEALGERAASAAQQHAAVEIARAELDRARAVLEQEVEDLRGLARRAFNYARVYAGDDVELTRVLDEMEMHTPPSLPRARRVKGGRKKAARTTQLALSREDMAAESAAAAVVACQPSISPASLSSSDS